MSTLKGIVALIEIILVAAGLIPVSTEINYGGNEYTAPSVTNPMYIVENGNSDYFIVTENRLL